jgi:predicted dinucleotide-binding enzyme
MKISIIGVGNVGGALARAWSRTGHDITLGARDVTKPEVKSLAETIGAEIVPPAEAARLADIVVLSLPWHVAEQAVSALGDLTGKIVIDCMNPLVMKDGVLGLDRGFATSGGETVASWLPGAFVVKTLNQVGFEVMADASGFGAPPVQFVAGDNESAKKTVAELLTDLGFQPFDAGELSKARLLEPFGMVWINQALLRGKGRNWAFAALDRG